MDCSESEHINGRGNQHQIPPVQGDTVQDPPISSPPSVDEWEGWDQWADEIQTQVNDLQTAIETATSWYRSSEHQDRL